MSAIWIKAKFLFFVSHFWNQANEFNPFADFNEKKI